MAEVLVDDVGRIDLRMDRPLAGRFYLDFENVTICLRREQIEELRIVLEEKLGAPKEARPAC